MGEIEKVRGIRIRAMYVLSRAGSWDMVLERGKECEGREGGYRAFDHLFSFAYIGTICRFYKRSEAAGKGIQMAQPNVLTRRRQ